jgi:hypothetical protein
MRRRGTWGPVHATTGAQERSWGVGTGPRALTHTRDPDGPVVYVAPDGADGPSCGSAAATPCATLRYAIEGVGNALQPLTATVAVVVAPGGYGPASCGASARRPFNITGPGSAVATVDCGYTTRLLLCNDSLALTGVTVTGGLAVGTVTSPGPGDPNLYTPFGGGAVSVTWGPEVQGAWAVLQDIAFLNNTVAITVAADNDTETASVRAYVGGGALFVYGGGSGCSVALTGVTFHGNNATTFGEGSMDHVHAGGGGACIALGCPTVDGRPVGPVVGVTVGLQDVVVVGNVLHTSGEFGSDGG